MHTQIIIIIKLRQSRSQARLKKEEGEENTSLKIPGSAGPAVSTWKGPFPGLRGRAERVSLVVVKAISLGEGDPEMKPLVLQVGG